MDIYSDDFLFLEAGTYFAKETLGYSIDSAEAEKVAFANSSPISGIGHAVLARVEALGACFFMTISALSSIPVVVISGATVTLAVPLNLVSRLPGLSSFQMVQSFTEGSSSLILRIGRLTVISLPAYTMFFMATIAACALPEAMSRESFLIKATNLVVRPLGPFQRITAYNSATTCTGFPFNPFFWDWAEEALRNLSCENQHERVHAPYIHHHYTVYS